MRVFAIVIATLLMVACGVGSQEPKTAREAVELTCDRLMAGDYDAVLDRMLLTQAKQPAKGETMVAEWAEQQASEMIKAMMRSQLQALFENPDNPITGYEIRSEEYAPDSTKAELVVAFKLRDTALLHTFSMRRGEDGTWYSNQQARQN